MSVEGLWWFQTTSVQNPDAFEAGGVVVLETNRVLGGDSVYSYVGDFQFEGNIFTARVRVRKWNAEVEAENIFGMTGPVDYVVEVRGERQGEMIVGKLHPIDQPSFNLPARMVFIERLPG